MLVVRMDRDSGSVMEAMMTTDHQQSEWDRAIAEFKAALRDTFSGRDWWLFFIGMLTGMAMMILGHILDGVIS